MKCVVWDLDGTVWDATAIELEQGVLPEPRTWVLDAIDFLAARGIPSSVASRSDPSLEALLRADPRFAERFIAPQVAWQDKSAGLTAISERLGIALNTLVFVDNDPYERAEVRAALPEVLVLEPENVPALLDSLPRDPGTLTEAARGRVARYREEEFRRGAAETFTGSHEDFLAYCDMRLTIRPARKTDSARLAELAARTHRLNSSGITVTPEELLATIDDRRAALLPVAELTDRFGGYGLIGTAMITVGADSWELRLLALSCRVSGRGVSLAFLRWILLQAKEYGARTITVPVRVSGTNVELRLLLRQCGLRAEAPVDGLAVFQRGLGEALPEHPAWIRLEHTTEVR